MKPIAVTAALEDLARIFQSGGAALYAVGGMVRNSLLSLPVQDVDICSPMLLEEAEALLREKGVKTKQKGAFFGTLDIEFQGERFEYASFRAERYGEGGDHKPSEVTFGATLEEDAFRRDFTVNALYYDILAGEVIDPTGGLRDLEAGLIRATSPDPNIILRDDGLRILRMARFAAELGFTVEENTLIAAGHNSSGLRDIAPERIREELDKILLSDIRYLKGKDRVLYGLALLRDCRALDVILPEVAAGRGIEQRKEYHAYDVETHMLHSAAAAPARLHLRMAALLHDVGKPVAFRNTGKMLGHDVIGTGISREILTRLRYPNHIIDQVTTLVRWHMYDLNGSAKESTLRRRFAQWGRDTSHDLVAIREADVHGSGLILGEVKSAERWKKFLLRMDVEHAPFHTNELDCTGKDIMEWLSLPPSPRIGEVKMQLLLHCACHPKDNCRERLQKITKDIGAKATWKNDR
ncbi:MAG: CCA tRNA nucleotidyltransferase [Clostridiales bacterium]|nr:CCA tRNA nucleotidyltransferase [Clostridiales bacterium]